MTPIFPPPSLRDHQALDALLLKQGFAVLAARSVTELVGCTPDDLAQMGHFCEGLAADNFLKDGGRYRRRRHSCFVVEGDLVTQTPHRAHWQPVEYNALHGGMERLFEPIAPDMLAQPVWTQLLVWLAGVCSELKGSKPWFVEAHPFRIDTTDGIGRPTPEGAHRDGVDLVAVFMVARVGVKGGETRVFDAAGPDGQRFTLTEPWSVLLLDDDRVIHESTPIQPLMPDEQGSHRDTLVITLRAAAFQADSV